MIDRYEPFVRYADYTGEEEARMEKRPNGEYVTYYDHMREVTKLQERIAELQTDRDGRWYGDV